MKNDSNILISISVNGSVDKYCTVTHKQLAYMTPLDFGEYVCNDIIDDVVCETGEWKMTLTDGGSVYDHKFFVTEMQLANIEQYIEMYSIFLLDELRD